MAPGLEADALPRTFQRTWSSRATALGGLLGSTGLLLWMGLTAEPSDVPVATWIVLGVFAAISGALVVTNFFDRITVSGAGIVFSNRLLGRLGWTSPRLLGWEDIATLHEPRKRVLFLVSRSGRRHVIDSIDGYDDLRARVYQEVKSRDGGPGAGGAPEQDLLQNPDSRPDFPGA